MRSARCERLKQLSLPGPALVPLTIAAALLTIAAALLTIAAALGALLRANPGAF